jgi:hypothetical protein
MRSERSAVGAPASAWGVHVLSVCVCGEREGGREGGRERAGGISVSLLLLPVSAPVSVPVLLRLSTNVSVQMCY